MTLKDTLLGLFIIVIWGVNFVVIAWGLDGIPPLLMGAERFLLVALLGSFIIKKPDIPWRWLALYALTIAFGQFAFLFSAMAFGMPAGLASLVLQSQAIFTLIFAALFLKEGIKPLQIVAMLVAGGGLYIIGATQQNTTMTGLGFGLTIAGAVCWASGNIINRLINQRGYQVDTGLIIWSSWIPPIPFLMASFYFEGQEQIIASIVGMQWTSFAALFYLAIAASIIGYTSWSYLLSRYPAAQVAPLTLGVPVVGLASASLLLNETMSDQQIIGIGLVLIGLLVNSFSRQISSVLQKAGIKKASRVND